MNKEKHIKSARPPAAGPFRLRPATVLHFIMGSMKAWPLCAGPSLLCLFTCLFFMLPPCEAENYLINGGQESQIDYKMEQRVQPAPATRKLILNYVVPENFQSPTYNQKIQKFDLR